MLKTIEIEKYMKELEFELLSWKTHFVFADSNLSVGIDCLLHFEISMN